MRRCPTAPPRRPSATRLPPHPGALDIPYAPASRTTLDLYPATDPAAPCLVFIHGGYWQRNSRDLFACFAEGPAAAGWSVAMPGHTLAPEASLRIPALTPGTAWAYVKHCSKIGEFAHAIAAVRIEPGAGRGRVVIGAIEKAPLVIADARDLFGGRIGPDFAERFDRHAADALLRGAGIADAVSRHVHVTVLARAVAQAASAPPSATRSVSEAA